MQIRLAQKQDIPQLLNLLDQVGEVHHQLRPDIFRPGTQKYDAAALAALLQDETRPIYVAEHEGTVAGYCFCVVKEFSSHMWVARREFYIDDLCIDETMRRKGIAQALYDYALEQAKDRGCNSLTLNVWCGNDSAMAFYQKQGMTPRNILMEQRL